METPWEMERQMERLMRWQKMQQMQLLPSARRRLEMRGEAMAKKD